MKLNTVYTYPQLTSNLIVLIQTMQTNTKERTLPIIAAKERGKYICTYLIPVSVYCCYRSRPRKIRAP